MPEDNEPSRSGLVEALARLGDERIGGGQVFGTFTFKDPSPRPGSPLYTAVGHGGAVRAMDRYLTGVAEVYPGVAAFVAMEPHKDRVSPHFHALFGGLPDGVPLGVDRRRRRPVTGPFEVMHAKEVLWQSWYEANGLARLEKVDGNGVGLYVSKYAMKGGGSIPWWVIHEPGDLRQRWVTSLKRRKVR